MFFQLAQIERLSKSTQELDKTKQKLNSYVIDAYQSNPTVKNSLTSTIGDILAQAVLRSQLFKTIQEDAINGFLIPSFLDFQGMTADRGDLPEWTRVVFEKEFQKQKKSLDVMAKKIYTSHSLSQARDRHLQQLNAFRILSDRYRVLSEHDETIDIMNEADKLKNLTKLTSEKYLSFCNVIAARLTSFIQEMAGKCCNFSSQINKFVGKSTNAWMKPQPQMKINPLQRERDFGFENKTTSNWLNRATRTSDKNFYRSAKNPQQAVLRQPKWMSTLSDYYY